MQDNISNLRSYLFKSQTSLYPRIGHKIVPIQNFLFVFGGVNLHNDFNTSVLKINCQNYQIDIINTKNSYPIEGFSVAVQKQVILLWGGTRPSGNSNDLWMFENNSFSKIAQKGNIPSPRAYQSSVYFANRYMIIYGGVSQKQIFNEWYLLDLHSKQWKKLNPSLKLPDNIDSKMIWISGRGILLLTQIFSQQQKKIIYTSKMYEFRITNFQKGQLKIEPLDIYNENEKQDFQIQNNGQLQSRGSPTLCAINSDATYVAVLGGENFRQVFKKNQVKLYSDMWIVNLQTLSYSKAINVKLNSRYGSQAIFYKDRVVVVGGISDLTQFSQNLEVVDLIYQKISIQRKLCKACQDLYGLDDFNKTKVIIKCDYQINENSFVSGSLVSKMADTIRNPIKAFGLLMDNCLNMNANLISVKIQKKKMNQKYFKNPYCSYLTIQDNSYGFNKDEVVEALVSFGHKIQTTTCDNKYEEQVAVRKQFGVNLKLASLRLGKSCLYITNVIQDELFVGYFSVKNQHCPEFKDRFNCFYYFVGSDGLISSQTNRHIINNNVRHLIDLSHEEFVQFTKNDYSPSTQQINITRPHKSKIIIFDFNYKEEFQFLSLADLQFEHGEGYPFRKLRSYLQSFYLNPYIGRSIFLQNQLIVYQNFIQKFRKDEYQYKIKKVQIKASQANNFKFILLFQVLSTAYQIKSVLVYSQNRLIESFNFEEDMLCGVIQLNEEFSVDICKTRIQNIIDQKRLKNHIRQLKQSKKRILSNKQPEDSIRSLNYLKDQANLNRLNKSQAQIAQNYSFQFSKKSNR